MKPVTVTLTRDLAAPVDLVWQVWTDPEHVVRWMKCEKEATLELQNWSAEEGARFSSVMKFEDQFEVRETGRFIEVIKPRVLAWVSDPNPDLDVPELRVRVEFESLGPRLTRVTVRHSGIPKGFLPNVITGGWTGSLDQLKALLNTMAFSSPLNNSDIPA